MDESESLSHSKWECKYHVVFMSRSAVAGRCTSSCVAISGRCSVSWRSTKESQILEGHLMPDHVHMLIAIPPKSAVSQVVGYIKGKSAIHLARVYGERKRNFVGSTSGREAISYPLWVGMKRRCESTSATKGRKITVLTR